MSGPRPGIPALSRVGLEAAGLALTEAALGRRWVLSLAPKDVEAVTRAALTTYLTASRGRFVKTTPAATRQIAAMAVGDTVEFDDETLPYATWRSRLKAARLLMANPSAAWWSRAVTGANRIRITRLADGASEGRTRGAGVRSEMLAGMSVGQTVTVQWEKLWSPDKRGARRAMGDPNANWKSRRTSKGLKLERVR